MPPVTYTVAIDWDDDGDFTDTGENITADVLHMTWRLGLAQPYDSLAPPISAQITLRNASRAYSPEYSAYDLQPGKPIRIQSDDGLTTRTHFTGFISRVEPMPGALGQRLSIIHASGPEPWLAQHHIRLPPQVNVTADQVVAAALDALHLRLPVIGGYWLLDVPGHAELDSSTRLGGTYPRVIETGQSTFAYTADTWGAGLPADEALLQMAESERGRVFVNRFGQIVFFNRHHTLLSMTALASFADNMDGLAYAYGAEVTNRVQVAMIPRSIGAAGTTLWRLESAQAIQPGEAGLRRLVAPFRDGDSRPIGALTVIEPAAGVDYQANTLADGTGVDVTAQLVVRLVETGASGATLEIRNDSPSKVYLLAGAQLRGTPIIQGDPLLIEQVDWAGVNRYGLNTLRLNTPALGSLEDADQLARFELARRKDPRGVVRSLDLTGALHLAQILARSLFDRITVQDTQTDHNTDYFIIAEEHTVDLGGARHRCRWLLEPASASAFWVLDSSHLDQTTVVGY
jgi:hypothetical protein